MQKEDKPGLVKFPTDKVLLQDPTFRRYVQLYAKVINSLVCWFEFVIKNYMKIQRAG